MRVFVGVDPGVSGGIAAVDETSRPLVFLKRPENVKEVLENFQHIRSLSADVRGVLERVNPGVFGGFGKKDKQRMGVVSSFTFGVGYGELRAMLVAAEIPFEEVSPQKWQGALNCRTGGDKNVSKAKAASLFPSVPKLTHAIADALLMAEYCRRVELGIVARPIEEPKKATTGTTGDF